jgi:hypothetical protein
MATTFRERFAEKATSVRAVVLLAVVMVLCWCTIRQPDQWREMFGNALCLVVGFYFRDAEPPTKPTATTGV